MNSAQHEGATGPWVRTFQPRVNPDARLVCLPHAGGSASYFYPVSKVLNPTFELLSIQYPGRQDRRFEPCIESVAGLADMIALELRPWLDKPLHLFGHSLGASVAFEVARRLDAQGSRPASLFVSGRRAPSRQRAESSHNLGDGALIAELRNLDGSDSRVLDDDEMIRLILPTLRSDYKAAEKYHREPDRKFSAPIFAHIGLDDPKVSVPEALDWNQHTTGEFGLTTHAGGHFYLDQHIHELIDTIEGTMTKHLPHSGMLQSDGSRITRYE